MASSLIHIRRLQELLRRWRGLLRSLVSGGAATTAPGGVPRTAPDAERFQIPLESAPDAILGIDDAGRIVVVNRQAEALFGYARAEMLAQPIEMLVPESQRASHHRHRHAYQNAPHTRPMGAASVPLYGLRKDGTTFPAEISLSPVTTAAGTLAMSIIRDVTDRMEAEAQRGALIRAQEARVQAERAQQRFHELVQDLNAIVWELDVVTGRFTFVSRRAQEMLGYPLELWLAEGGQWLQHIHPDDRGRIAAQIEARQDGSYEYRAITAHGRQLWLRLILHGAPGEDGLPRQLRGLTLDITEQKLAEDSVRVSDKLAATLRLASSLAHEINNPVSGVTNLLYLIEHESADNGQIRAYAQVAQQELTRVAHITRQMLAFYRDSSAAVPVDLGGLLHSIVELYGPRLRDQATSVELRVDARLSIHAFPDELRQAFSNLLLNAIEASPGGQVRINVHAAHDWADLRRPGVHITVADNGSGIAPQDRSHVFEPFFTNKRVSGSGLGLWVSEGVIRKHSGSIRLRSTIRPGRSGTSVSVFLPLAPTSPPDEAERARAASQVA